MLASKSVTELAAIRQTILASFGDFVSEATDSETMEKLTDVETQIENANFETDADKRLGNLILMEGKPSCWDNFQESLFLRMQEFA